MSSERNLRVGVIGLGAGRGHVLRYKDHPRADVVAVADANAALLDERAEVLGVALRYTDPLEMLRKEKLDIVSVATPNKFHYPLTLAALEAGCHVLCEKPIALNASEGRQMVAAAKRAQKRLMVNFSFRFTDQSWALKQQVEAGVLGDVYFGRTVWHRRRGLPKFGGWFGQKELSGGGALIDLGVHRLDLALWLMGHPRPVYAMAGTYNHIAAQKVRRENELFDVEDLAAGTVRFDNGALLVVEASWAANRSRSRNT
ncbi:MAG: Gfo/Idh/MocA family oxidoreductase [Lentisphaerae bacterium]|nr:Gfo/Idh/MocA family oxidoreductase [Lentisphaerota bacterium]